MEDQKVGLALYGLGRIGCVHLPKLLANSRIKLLWIVEGNKQLAKEVTEEFGIAGKVKLAPIEDIPKVLADSEVKAVFICTPTDTHAQLSIQALREGKHVLCEKPISEKTEDIVACFDEADKHGCILMAAFNRHFDVSYRDMYRRVRSGELGKVEVIKSTFRDTPLWMGAHSITQTFLIHDIDLICWFADDLPDTVVCVSSANIKEVAEKNDVDTVVVTMKFPSGTIGILDFCRYSSQGYDIRMEIYGTNGMLRMENPLQTTVKTYTETGCSDALFKDSYPERFKDAYIAEHNHFIDVVTGKQELEVKRVYSERVGHVMDAIRESYKSGQVVHLKK